MAVSGCGRMSKIFYLMGKSSSGKDTIYKKIRERFPGLRTITLYTTRPIRDGECEGVEYHFVNAEKLQEYRKAGKVIELRTYDTIYGEWNYFTVDDGQFHLENEDYLMIGTLESYRKMQEYFGCEVMVPLYIEVEDGERLMRALHRERQQKMPKYAEMCRRFLADTQDFSEEKLLQAGITKHYENVDTEQVLREISEIIQNHVGNLR